MIEIYAEDVNYWKTSSTSPGTWLDRAAAQVEKLGGIVVMKGEGQDPNTGKPTFLFAFTIGEENFKVVWPALPTKDSRDAKSARIQAATMLFHDIKARCISSYVLGTKTAFFAYYVLENGRAASEFLLESGSGD